MLLFCVLSKLCLCHNCALYRPDNKYPQTKLIEFAFCQQLSQLVGAKAVYRTSILERKRQKGAASTCNLVSIELAHRFSAFVSAVPSSARLLAHRRSIRQKFACYCPHIIFDFYAMTHEVIKENQYALNIMITFCFVIDNVGVACVRFDVLFFKNINSNS